MRAEALIPLDLLFGFLLTLARVGALLALVPLPGFGQAPKTARLVLALGLAFALAPARPPAPPPGPGTLLAWMASEAALGLTAGVVVALLNEGFVVACQTLGTQAGFSYATTIDPASQADSGVLQVFGHLTASLLFFSLGLDRHLIRICASGIASHPPGAFAPGGDALGAVVGLGAGMLTLGVRLALPVAGFLMLADIALALLGRLNAQLQLLMLAFPVKMLASMALLAAAAGAFPVLYERAAARSLAVLARLVGS